MPPLYRKGELCSTSEGRVRGLERFLLSGKAPGTAPEHLDTYDRRLDRAVSSQDVSRNLVASFVYGIPFGRGKRFAGNLPSFADKLIGNWQINGIVTYSTAPPLALSAPNNTNANSTTQRPNLLHDAALPSGRSLSSKLQGWFDVTAFAQPATA